MRKIYCLLVLIFIVGCAVVTKDRKSAVLRGNLIQSSEKSPPKWTMEGPNIKGDMIKFVGVSNKYATESEGRDQALKNATGNAIMYMRSTAKDKFEKAATSFGLDLSVVAPATGSEQYQEQLVTDITGKIKAEKWYLEEWKTSAGIRWKVFTLATVPVYVINNYFKRLTKQNTLKAQQTAEDAADSVTRKQARKTVEFWKEMARRDIIRAEKALK